MNSEKIIDIVTQYMDAWNVSDETVRQGLLANCWADDGTYTDPGTDLTGRDALSRHIAKVRAARPGSRLEFMSGIDVHHGWFRFEWRLVRGGWKLWRDLNRCWRGWIGWTFDQDDRFFRRRVAGGSALEPGTPPRVRNALFE